VNSARSHLAHPRFCSARWPKPLTASGAAQTCPACLPSPTNQLTFLDDPRPSRPLKQGPRCAPCHASIGSFTQGRPAVFPSRNLAMDALIGNRRAGSQGHRPLAPLPFTSAPNQRTFTDRPDCARPFLPSSPSPKPRLRAERIGGVTSFDLSSGVPGNEFRDSSNYPARPIGHSYLPGHFPPSNDRQDSTFPTEKFRAEKTRFFRRPSRVRHASGRTPPSAQFRNEFGVI